MRTSARLLALAIAIELVGCTSRGNLAGVEAPVAIRPELVTLVDERGGPGVLFVWGTGPVNLTVPFNANCPAHPNGVIGGHKKLGAAFAGNWPRAPDSLDVVPLVLLPGPLRDSLGVTQGAATVTFYTPDSALAEAWAFVPQGPCGPDTIRAFVRLVRAP